MLEKIPRAQTEFLQLILGARRDAPSTRGRSQDRERRRALSLDRGCDRDRR